MLAPGLTQVFTFTAMTKKQIKATSGGKKLLIYDYEDAWSLLTEQIFDSFHMLDPLLRFMPPVRGPHAGPYRYTIEGQTLDQRPELVQYTGTGNADLREGDIEGHTTFLYNFAQAYVEAAAAQSFAMMPEVAELVGNKVGAEGQPFTVETFLEAVDKIWLRFVGDEELVVTFIAHPQAPLSECLFVAPPGAIIGFVHPDKLETIKRASWTQEQQQRYDQIIARKRAEQHAKKRTRRLS
jgi:hypothetical protein